MKLTPEEEDDLDMRRKQLAHGAYNCLDGHKERLEKRIKELELKQSYNDIYCDEQLCWDNKNGICKADEQTRKVCGFPSSDNTRPDGQ